VRGVSNYVSLTGPNLCRVDQHDRRHDMAQTIDVLEAARRLGITLDALPSQPTTVVRCWGSRSHRQRLPGFQRILLPPYLCFAVGELGLAAPARRKRLMGAGADRACYLA
jgi:hypothetical protein